MSGPAKPPQGSPRSGRRGPRPGNVAWRDHILDAARALFGEHGFEGTTVRQIAERAGVDAKLVYYYFGSKEELFGATIAAFFRAGRFADLLVQTVDAAPAEADPSQSPGGRYVKAVLTVIEGEEIGPGFLSLVRGLGAHEPSRRIFVRFVTAEFIARVAPQLQEPWPEARATLAGSHVLGLVMARYVLKIEPLATLPIDQIAALMGPVLDHYALRRQPLAPDVRA
ncbi:MAG: TetR family transcriptional regulator [Bifidobacteriaceae bacterium]|jgi:AcrR family transcriptional regulator|nr:TetR family transcriptional regulator [Bifidobacteriaceae bacterium]